MREDSDVRATNYESSNPTKSIGVESMTVVDELASVRDLFPFNLFFCVCVFYKRFRDVAAAINITRAWLWAGFETAQ